MSFTNIISEISIDLQKPSTCEVVYAKQYDRLTRKIAVSVYNYGAAYLIPTTNVKYVVRATKPDGTICIYENTEDGLSAVSVSSHIATITLSQQVLTCVGDVKMELSIQNTDSSEIITSFYFIIKVEASALNRIASTDFPNPIIPTEYLVKAELNSIGDRLTLTPNKGVPIVFAGGQGIAYINKDDVDFDELIQAYDDGKIVLVKFVQPDYSSTPGKILWYRLVAYTDTYADFMYGDFGAYGLAVSTERFYKSSGWYAIGTRNYYDSSHFVDTFGSHGPSSQHAMTLFGLDILKRKFVSDWVNNKDYYFGDYVFEPITSRYGDFLHKCIVPHATKGTWISSEWSISESNSINEKDGAIFYLKYGGLSIVDAFALYAKNKQLMVKFDVETPSQAVVLYNLGYVSETDNLMYFYPVYYDESLSMPLKITLNEQGWHDD